MYALYLHNIVIVINEFFLCNHKQDTVSHKTGLSTCDKHNTAVDGRCKVQFCNGTLCRNVYCLVCVAKRKHKMCFGSGGYLRDKFTMVCRDYVPELTRHYSSFNEDSDIIPTDDRFYRFYARCHRNKTMSCL